jgi:predicted component of type VI protein secretion system
LKPYSSQEEYDEVLAQRLAALLLAAWKRAHTHPSVDDGSGVNSVPKNKQK